MVLSLAGACLLGVTLAASEPRRVRLEVLDDRGQGVRNAVVSFSALEGCVPDPFEPGPLRRANPGMTFVPPEDLGVCGASVRLAEPTAVLRGLPPGLYRFGFEAKGRARVVRDHLVGSGARLTVVMERLATIDVRVPAAHRDGDIFFVELHEVGTDWDFDLRARVAAGRASFEARPGRYQLELVASAPGMRRHFKAAPISLMAPLGLVLGAGERRRIELQPSLSGIEEALQLHRPSSSVPLETRRASEWWRARPVGTPLQQCVELRAFDGDTEPSFNVEAFRRNPTRGWEKVEGTTAAPERPGFHRHCFELGPAIERLVLTTWTTHPAFVDFRSQTVHLEPRRVAPPERQPSFDTQPLVELEEGRLVVVIDGELGTGLRRGDQLLEVNGEPVDGLLPEEAAERLRAGPGARVRVKVRSAEGVRTVNVVTL